MDLISVFLEGGHQLVQKLGSFGEGVPGPEDMPISPVRLPGSTQGLEVQIHRGQRVPQIVHELRGRGSHHCLTTAFPKGLQCELRGTPLDHRPPVLKRWVGVERMPVQRSNGNRANERRPRPAGAVAELAADGRQELHNLNNTLASLRLRLGILAADRTCLDAQGENLISLLAIADEAIQGARRLQPVLDAAAGTGRLPGAPPRRARANGRG
jgi:hypothetical protein